MGLHSCLFQRSWWRGSVCERGHIRGALIEWLVSLRGSPSWKTPCHWETHQHCWRRALHFILFHSLSPLSCDGRNYIWGHYVNAGLLSTSTNKGLFLLCFCLDLFCCPLALNITGICFPFKAELRVRSLKFSGWIANYTTDGKVVSLKSNIIYVSP